MRNQYKIIIDHLKKSPLPWTNLGQVYNASLNALAPQNWATWR